MSQHAQWAKRPFPRLGIGERRRPTSLTPSLVFWIVSTIRLQAAEFIQYFRAVEQPSRLCRDSLGA
eukprot:15430487-Alexandrium_andersonii.AAC.1